MMIEAGDERFLAWLANFAAALVALAAWRHQWVQCKFH
jgi:hypothetical protein